MLKSIYDRSLKLSRMLNEYSELLDKALQLGQLTLINYL